MGASNSKEAKVSKKDSDAVTARGVELQNKYNLWPEGVRKEGTTFASKDHAEELQGPTTINFASTAIGSHLPEDRHSFDTQVAAISTENAPSGRVFAYGMAKFTSTGDEQRPEIMAITYDAESKVQGVVRYTDYFSQDGPLMVDNGTLSNEDYQAANKLTAEPTSSPADTPADTKRQERMAKALNGVLSVWRDSPESSVTSRSRFTPWRRVCAGNALDAAVKKYCTEDCTISMPLQQIVIEAADLRTHWAARLQGEGPFVSFGQTEVFTTAEAYAGHHPCGFAQVVFYSANSQNNQHNASNGLLVAEFDDEGNKMKKIIMFREFLDDQERASVVIPFVSV